MMMLLSHLFLALLLSAAAVIVGTEAGGVAAAAVNTGESKDAATIKNFPSLVDWFHSNDGKIDPRITLGYEGGGDDDGSKKGIRGLIATAHIEPETVLIHTPESLMITTAEGTHCGIIQRIIDELSLGDDSKWSTYFQFDGSNNFDDEASSSSPRVPTEWKMEGQPGSRALSELQGLPPAGETHRHINWYTTACNDSNEQLTDVQLRAFSMFLTRAADLGMVPMYDLMNHHNGLINTRLEVDNDGGLSVISTTAIQAGVSIYNTYAREGAESSVDVFNTYGFVEDYPQLWRWSDKDMIQLVDDDPNHAFQRYVNPEDNTVGVDVDGRGFEPNSHHYEILVVSPTLGALHPTKALVKVLGNGQRSIHEWEQDIAHHHATLRTSFVNAMHDSAQTILGELPTSIEQDETLILPNEKRLYEKVKKVGRVDPGKEDTIQAIEYRLAFKKALKLAVDIAEREKFYVDSEEL
jgi:hypothetical protein